MEGRERGRYYLRGNRGKRKKDRRRKDEERAELEEDGRQGM